ncbi:hypothetical protein [Streptomyces wuyuanensis]|uniref:Uncharacterized protein n=1 Tax=Streptomyces wuyuanensis TaxID=1196353 RepID=A0A1G9VX32_9ACTN|nr:hypothetical protein [Streptomyces wuyuanensis]SDM76511.1 hypothetical protein SAMN05444921_11319 [Streptomyces wuyuanensis]
MTDRAAIAKMLRAGATYAEVRAELGVGSDSVTSSVRKEYGIPVVPRPRPHRPAEDTFRLYAQPVDGGHRRWTGPWAGRMPQITLAKKATVSALRVAFRIRTGRDPVGYVRRTCNYPGCVEPGHLADRAERS